MKKTQNQISRREFFKRTTVAGAAIAMPAIVPSSVLGQNSPSNSINMGLIGMGLMMQGHMRTMSNRDDVRVLAVCDVHKGKREKAKGYVENTYARRFEKDSYKGCDAYNEFERIIQRDDIDAVMVVTPDHWHAAISIAAMESGKDVYVQKPMTLTVREGRAVSDVASRSGAILQVGSQQRSNVAFRKACEIVRNGWIGKVHTIYARLGRFAPPATLPEQPIPEGFDYDRWLGPTPWYPYNIERVKGDYGGGWRRFWEYGSRKNGDWGAHHFDIIQWALGMDDSGPVEFIPKGYEGAGYQTHIYKDGTKVLRDHSTRDGHMIQFVGTEGEVMVSRGNRLDTIPAELKNKPLAPQETHLYQSREHQDNWIQCIKTRKQPICTAEIGHRSATICQLSGVAERLKRPLKWNPETEEIIGDAEASRWLDRPRRAPYVII
ncbi:MAG: Gfo/Idh/MocA family oxidoreductase [Verrucomicrobia bacterium]|nr:Gfo/Idh/MocA family oxidoreductase [Verrucomicrobiota bacterium]